MVKGMIEGYARKLFVSTDKQGSITNCQSGFWKPQPDQGKLVPNGKWTWLTSTDNKDTMTKVKFGVYGSKIEGKKVRLVKCGEKEYKNARKNKRPDLKKVSDGLFSKNSKIYLE